MNFTCMLSCLSLLLAAVAAQQPKPCEAPPLLSGDFSWIFGHGLTSTGKFDYDATAKRSRIRELRKTGNSTEFMDQLTLFSESAFYIIDWATTTCTKWKLDEEFIPMSVPEDAKLFGQFFMGSSSSSGTGVLVNNWYGSVPGNGTYSYVFTDNGCVPISLTTYNPYDGWATLSTYNWVEGIIRPQDFFPPRFCDGARLEETKQPLTFFTALQYLANSILDE
ncbi:ependymin-2-like [Acanthochromis polyacanthus]|uniref:ependymin-2-like n=1 Tax=Acanthochromis polyacanthus TaxID=80966 RepID=UPI002234DD25|nr:ependymin-2-like [Acanthochromis polyacanthus]XP_051801118.1 ependymin-2-like [Acanthochromis polyacanthus]